MCAYTSRNGKSPGYDIVPNESQSRVYQNDSISYEMISYLMKVNPEFIRMIAFHTK